MSEHALDELPADDGGAPREESGSAPPAPPLRERIRQLAARRASGDLTCAAAHAGVRAHMQAGRLAWAHDATHPRAFAARLCELARLDPAMVDALGKECLRTHRPLGETLVARGLATAEQVRAAVRGQIELAFLCCRWCGSCRAGFRAGGAEPVYDPALTFSVEELEDAPGGPPARPPPAAEEEEPPPFDWNVPLEAAEPARDCLDLDLGGELAPELPETARRAVAEVLGQAGIERPAAPPAAEDRARRLAARLEAWLAARARH